MWGGLCFLGRVGWCWCMVFSVFGLGGEVCGVRRGKVGGWCSGGRGKDVGSEVF